MGRGTEQLLLVLLVFPAFLGFLWLKARMTRRYVVKRLEKDGVDAQILKVGVPPLHLWLKNRKGDSWAKLRFADGTEKWARIRDRLFGDTSFDLFD